MKKEPLVSVTIPSRNSEKFLDKCLEAINLQTYKNIEIIIVDGNSKDKTKQIAEKYNVNEFINYEYALLGARFEGVKKSKGDLILLLDSDQILEDSAIERAVKQMEKYDGLILEEKVYNNKTFIEKLFKLDRELVHKVKDFSPYTGVMLPRFYKKNVLESAFNNIPKDLLRNVGGQDHAIIYFEVWNKTQRIGFLENAVFHIEPSDFKTMWKKFYRWGYTSTSAHHGKYEEMLRKKERFRKGLFQKDNIKESFASILLLLIKGIPYKLGYLVGKYVSK
jgi:glycosyltransferase involved in cell wall biosynthesis